MGTCCWRAQQSVATGNPGVEVKVEKRNDADCRGALGRGVSKCDRGFEMVGGAPRGKQG